MVKFQETFDENDIKMKDYDDDDKIFHNQLMSSEELIQLPQ